MQQHETLLPSWLARTAERAQRPLPLPEVTEQITTCTVERRDGFAVKRCEEIRERFRLCADGRKEVVESTCKTTWLPVLDAPSSSSGSRDAEEFSSSVAPVVSATLGQMLDDFFAYANELQHSLEQQGVDVSGVEDPGWHLPRPQHLRRQQQQQEAVSSSSGLGLFGWWQRKKASRDAPAAAAGEQPSLQQLVRESSSETQEI